MKYPNGVEEKVSPTHFKNSKIPFRKFLRIILIAGLTCTSLFTTIFYLNEESEIFKEDFSSHSSRVSTLMNLIKYDFLKLQEANFLSESLTNVKEIRFKNRAENLKLEKKDLINFIKVKPSGNFMLTVEFYPFPEEDQSFLVQFNWIDIKSKDKIWEMNRVYRLKRKK